jgi:DNA gyrase subunit A
MAITEKNGLIVASFPIENDDQIMLVTDGGKLIRVPVQGIRVAGRATQGVIVFDTAKGEKVVSVERISEPEEDEDENEIAQKDEAQADKQENQAENQENNNNAKDS